MHSACARVARTPCEDNLFPVRPWRSIPAPPAVLSLHHLPFCLFKQPLLRFRSPFDKYFYILPGLIIPHLCQQLYKSESCRQGDCFAHIFCIHSHRFGCRCGYYYKSSHYPSQEDCLNVRPALGQQQVHMMPRPADKPVDPTPNKFSPTYRQPYMRS